MTKALIPEDLRQKLIENGRLHASGEKPIADVMVKLFTPMIGCTWLVTELDPEEPDIAFGLADLGMQSPELGSFLISELESLAGTLRWVERDLYFRPAKTLVEYADEARQAGRIVT